MRKEAQDALKQLERIVNSPKLVALHRIEMSKGAGLGAAAFYSPFVKDALIEWLDLVTSFQDEENLISSYPETDIGRTCLQTLSALSTTDSTLSEEFGREGVHVVLAKIIRLEADTFSIEENQDILMEMQDLACNVASSTSSFPLKSHPFLKEDIVQRLPLIFSIDDINKEGVISILISEVVERQTEQKDVGFVMWPSAVALSRLLVREQTSLVKGKTILELGSGCGLSGMVAAALIERGRLNAKKEEDIVYSSVTLTDFNSAVIENCSRNIRLNCLTQYASVEPLDFYEQAATNIGWLDKEGVRHDQVDIVIGADIICRPEDAVAVARTVSCSLRPSGEALILCGGSAHRFGIDSFEQACINLNLNVQCQNLKDIYDGELLDSAAGMEKTAGFVEEMSLVLFTINKRA